MSLRSFLVPLFLVIFSTGHAQDLMVYGTIRDLFHRTPVAGAMARLENGQGILIDRWTTGDSGTYEFTLQLEEHYALRFTAPGRFAKWVQIDTRNITASEEERQGGWGMNIDISLAPWIAGVEDSLARAPFGKAMWNAADTGFQWDIAYTERIRDAWAPIVAGVKDKVAAPLPVLDRPPPPDWLTLALMILLVLAGRWGYPLLLHLIRDRPAALVRLPWVFLTLAVASAAIAWTARGSSSSFHVYQGVAWVATAVLGFSAIRASRPLLERWMPDEVPPMAADNERAERIHGRMLLIGGVLSMLSAIPLYASLDHTLYPEVHYVRSALVAVGVFVLLRMILARTFRRWFVGRVHRLRAWAMLLATLLIVIPGAIQFVDLEFSYLTTSRTAEITDLTEVTQRKRGPAYYATVLVDGREKELKLQESAWLDLNYTDALEITLAEGPFGIVHIIDQWPILRHEEVSDEEAEASEGS